MDPDGEDGFEGFNRIIKDQEIILFDEESFIHLERKYGKFDIHDEIREALKPPHLRENVDLDTRLQNSWDAAKEEARGMEEMLESQGISNMYEVAILGPKYVVQKMPVNRKTSGEDLKALPAKTESNEMADGSYDASENLSHEVHRQEEPDHSRSVEIEQDLEHVSEVDLTESDLEGSGRRTVEDGDEWYEVGPEGYTVGREN
ncbi:MAG: hypothetical protein ABEK01_04405 [Candidatus Nanohaloarchaea archaeon]